MTEKDMEKKWLEAFAVNVDKESLEKYVYEYGNYLWHIFSWELVPCLEGDDARKAFDSLEYDKAIVFRSGYSNGCAVTEGLKQTGKISAQELEDKDDVYITAMDFSWTYVHTHEVQCGPYFCRKSE